MRTAGADAPLPDEPPAQRLIRQLAAARAGPAAAASQAAARTLARSGREGASPLPLPAALRPGAAGTPRDGWVESQVSWGGIMSCEGPLVALAV